MINDKICCFAGHREISDEKVFDNIVLNIEKLILNNKVNEFWVGNYGVFDMLCAKAVKLLKKKYKISLILIIPYYTKKIMDNIQWYNEVYDDVRVINFPPNTPEKYKIIKVNQFMVDYSDFVICYVKSKGGACKTMDYAILHNKKVINIV